MDLCKPEIYEGGAADNSLVKHKLYIATTIVYCFELWREPIFPYISAAPMWVDKCAL